MKPLVDCHVVIVGLGLMGGSLARALRGKCRTVTGVARRPETVEYAVAHDIVDRGTTDPTSAVKQADILVLATPVRSTIDLLREYGHGLSDGCLVMDLGSTKSHVLAAMSELPDGVQPIGGHPMCGKETAGIEAATPNMYRNCTFVLTPLPRTSTAARALAEELVAAIGARASVMSPDRHDSLVAFISHLPYILACTLVETTQEASSRDPAVWDLASSGYRSMSRLAASDVTMMLDILATNKEEILAAVRAFEGHLQSLAQSILSGDDSKARSALAAIRAHHIETS